MSESQNSLDEKKSKINSDKKFNYPTPKKIIDSLGDSINNKSAKKFSSYSSTKHNDIIDDDDIHLASNNARKFYQTGKPKHTATIKIDGESEMPVNIKGNSGEADLPNYGDAMLASINQRQNPSGANSNVLSDEETEVVSTEEYKNEINKYLEYSGSSAKKNDNKNTTVNNSKIKIIDDENLISPSKNKAKNKSTKISKNNQDPEGLRQKALEKVKALLSMQDFNELHNIATKPNIAISAFKDFYQDKSWSNFKKPYVKYEGTSNADDGSTVFTYIVYPERNSSAGFPVSAIANADGVSVDALLFLEFKEKFLFRFAGFEKLPASVFRVIISKQKTKSRNSGVNIDKHFDIYNLSTPNSQGKGILGMAPKNSQISKILNAKLKSQRAIFATVELNHSIIKKINQPFIRIADIPSWSWNLLDIVKYYNPLIPVKD